MKTRSSRLRKREQRRRALEAYLFLLPWFGGMLLFTAGPLLASLYLSFTNFDLLQAPTWVGLENYIDLFTLDPRYLHALRVTFTYVLIGVPFNLAFALLIAVLMNQKVKALGLFRSIYYLPSLLGGSVAVAVMWRQLFGREGAINDLVGLFGVDSENWISNPRYALYTLILLHVWQFGSAMVIFLAGLQQIPKEMYEAAEVDGANAFHKFLNVTLPLLTPVIFFNLVLGIINSFQAFTSAYIVSGGSGGPADSTLFYTLYLYQEGFMNFRMGYASAMGWILLLIVGAFTALNFVASSKWVFYGDKDE
ncbi:multiple sugar transport system permease protein [Neorhizobium sp. 2083]|uniref:carbohydrate ABC transporter permease n=1 Tax=Neorhizobium sp. 2083 TaxID=2817762 RepID=UPI0028660BCE|nr:sugar ABC transporter permease [Neorhizobium sp. 2083]MDR6817428.1 multiple sugar transport system permease protein [Neorhizobium sp. 2083]